MAAEKRKRKPKRKRKRLVDNTQYVYRDDKRHRISKPMLFSMLLIFAGLLSMALTHAYINDIRTDISEAREAVQTQREINTAQRAAFTQMYTQDEVARIAAERLGMSKPDASQIIRIYVPKQSYVVLGGESNEPEADKPLWRKVTDYLRQMIRAE